jgi:hypothetical protein
LPVRPIAGSMKPLLLVAVLLLCTHRFASAFDPKAASTERFKVEYVEPAKTPDISALPIYYQQRDAAIRDEQEAIKKGLKPEAIEEMRRIHFRNSLYPIRATDLVTGIIYEVQSDRRTIVAKSPVGKIIWQANPFEDAKLMPYRFEHPFIVYFGKSNNNGRLNGEILDVAFNSSQFGDIELESGKFHNGGRD